MQVATGLRRLIRKRELGIGDAIPTEKDLCARFHCSRGTVRRALDTLVNEGLVRRRQGSGHFVARQVLRAREALFGLIVPNILNAEILRLSQLFTLEASRKGYRVVLCVTSLEPTLDREFARELHRLRVAGVIKFPTLPEIRGHESEIRACLRGFGLPYVIINDFWNATHSYHHVAFDEAAAIDMAVDHLAGLGHVRIGWLDGSDGPRRRGLAHLRRAVSRRGMELSDQHVLRCPPYERPPIERLWGRGAGAPTAIITPYDGMAVRLIETLPQIGLQAPADVSVVNLNGEPFYGTTGLELTAATPPNEQIVAKALEILTDSAREQAMCQYLFRPSFHVGATSGPAKE